MKIEVLLFVKIYNNYSDLVLVYVFFLVCLIIIRKEVEVVLLINKKKLIWILIFKKIKLFEGLLKLLEFYL